MGSTAWQDLGRDQVHFSPAPLRPAHHPPPLGGSLGPTGSETCPPRLLPCVSLTRCFSATATWQCLRTVLSVAAGGVCYCCLVGRGRGCCSIPSNAWASPSNGTSTFPSVRQVSSRLSAFALALALPGMCSPNRTAPAFSFFQNPLKCPLRRAGFLDTRNPSLSVVNL